MPSPTDWRAAEQRQAPRAQLTSPLLCHGLHSLAGAATCRIASVVPSQAWTSYGAGRSHACSKRRACPLCMRTYHSHWHVQRSVCTQTQRMAPLTSPLLHCRQPTAEASITLCDRKNCVHQSLTSGCHRRCLLECSGDGCSGEPGTGSDTLRTPLEWVRGTACPEPALVNVIYAHCTTFDALSAAATLTAVVSPSCTPPCVGSMGRGSCLQGDAKTQNSSIAPNEDVAHREACAPAACSALQ